jgi:hypothetical protein
MVGFEVFGVLATEHFADVTFATEYAPDFSDARFRGIRVGTLRSDVYDLIGRPIGAVGPGDIPGLQFNCDLYSRPKQAPQIVQLLWIPATSWVSVRVCYDESGKVYSTPRWVFSR